MKVMGIKMKRILNKKVNEYKFDIVAELDTVDKVESASYPVDRKPLVDFDNYSAGRYQTFLIMVVDTFIRNGFSIEDERYSDNDDLSYYFVAIREEDDVIDRCVVFVRASDHKMSFKKDKVTNRVRYYKNELKKYQKDDKPEKYDLGQVIVNGHEWGDYYKALDRLELTIDNILQQRMK